jgi:hypothetical protein
MDNNIVAWLAAWRLWQEDVLTDLQPKWAVDRKVSFDFDSISSEAQATPTLPDPTTACW